ncbi:alcohol dehydrogenase catalytic domain-containing protein [Nocardioides bizhenqiangii]|uniref:alcohol dehydrogenase n=1 Tax=Nocardioides bizhenqiangii TaxID=3095076 RepID=A0ABZ0ZW26_9ACTN|nr:MULTISPECIES: alcohol dehydrogenase catalytic domain-containing protein [unclassified Nocardioides]MDZ5622388.1 alcohol dehydrogenase catalytic domain-containing protein [Nocardioides sp. HM23]WQQ28443.1 alcohol dehydrogenase catalytic domain-containing protein [Nocardioides sp. HM61]
MTGTPSTMRALRLLAWGAPPELVEVPVPVPSGTELLLRVDAAGLCHSDLHIMDAPAGALPYELPFTLGHEVVGSVVAAGDDAEPGWLGRRAAVHGVWSCGRCRQCRRGRENYCFALTGPIGGGIGRDGGLADYMLVPAARHLVGAEGVDPLAAAPLTDAGLTVQHALDTHRELLPHATVVVIGVGGLGHLALQLLAGHDPACVVAVEPRRAARQLAMKLGADAVVPAVANAAAWLDGCDGGHGADVVLDFVGTQETLAVAGTLLAPGGRLVVVGSAGGCLEVGKSAGLERGWGVSAPFWGTRRDLTAVIRCAEAGRIRAEIETYRLDDVLTAYECLRAGRVQGRAVVVPGQ